MAVVPEQSLGRHWLIPLGFERSLPFRRGLLSLIMHFWGLLQLSVYYKSVHFLLVAGLVAGVLY